MENQTRYDLNAAVENWRNELAAQPNLASDDRRELETHLRDTIAGFQQRGKNRAELFDSRFAPVLPQDRLLACGCGNPDCRHHIGQRMVCSIHETGMVS